MIKPFPKPYPKLQRLPERKHMTFVLGMLCNFGIVMCSDSLEQDGYSKSSVQKLYGFNKSENGDWGVAWGCAGDSPMIKRFNDKFLELLDNAPVAYARHDLEEVIETLIRQMRENYAERLSLVIALWGRSSAQQALAETRLYSIKESSNCLSVEEHFACAGMDLSLSRFLLDSIFTDDIPVSDGIEIATFVTAVMKEKADGVGGPTQMLFYRGGGTGWEEQRKEGIIEIEKRRYIIGNVERAIKDFWISCSRPKLSVSRKSKDQQ